MKRSPRRLPALVLMVMASLSLAAQAQPRDLEEQFRLFLSWWPGSYDNNDQALASSVAMKATRLYLQPVQLPAFGEWVVYGEWQDLASPATVTRQRFYGFEIDRTRAALRLKLHIFPLEKAFMEKTRGAHEDPSKVDGLGPDDMFPLPGCDVFFTWNGDHFAGAMDKGSCAFMAPGTDDAIYSWSQMRLTADTFEYLDGWFNPDGSVYRVLAPDWSIFKRRENRVWTTEP